MQLVAYTLFAFAHCGAHTNRTHTIDTSIALDYDVDSKHAKIFGKYQTVTELDLCKEKTQKVKKSTKTFFAVDDFTNLISTNIFQTYIIGKRKSRSVRRYNFLEIGVTKTEKFLIVQHNTIL